MDPRDYYNSYYPENEKRQDERLENSMNAINSMFEDKNEKDPLEDTMDIKKVELTELKELLARRYSEKEEDNHSEEKGKVLKKTLTNVKMSEDVEQIVNSFISCFILALVTASIGTGWLLYIINHI